METIPFGKLHGFGNDYIVVEKSNLGDGTDVFELAKEMCDRNRGVGGDGIALLDEVRGERADFSCRIINPDGSEAGFSGNGTRCAVAYLYFNNSWSDKNLRLETKSGIKNYEFLRREANEFWYLAELGKPLFAGSEIPFTGVVPESEVQNLEIEAAGGQVKITALNVGNPVASVFVENFDLDWRRIGSAIESHEFFPERTNVVFVCPKSENEVEIRIWERGAGETSSSGTCSIAAAVASAHTGRSGREVSVVAPGGITEAVWREDGEMLITGSAEMAFLGEWVQSR